MLVVDKPSGWTSHQVVGRVRRLAGTRKVGHAGTLDPMATGVLLVGLNRATRLLGHLMLTEKEYRATIRLGVGTLTDDAEGEVTTALGASAVTESDVAALLPQFRGDIQQVPTAVSAIKVNGVRSYARVRAGEQVELAARSVRVSRYDLVDVRRSGQPVTPGEMVDVLDLEVLVECSSGTYIRALARDLGAALGVGGHLTALRRTRVGPFGLDQASTLDQAAVELDLIDIDDVARRCFPTWTCDEEQASWVRHGRRLPEVTLPAETSAVMTGTGEFLALYRQVGPSAEPVSVFV
nr:tRNA pseudouridine(55) synthase TruB [Microlunatus panaciterrae]